jgi:hypothetical protein
VQDKGLAVQYRDEREVQDVVRMIGALQLVPSEVWNYSLRLICARIRETFNLLEDTAQKLMELVNYYR